MLQLYVASTVLVLKPFANITQGIGSETYKAISVAIYTEIKNDPSVSAYSRVWRKGVGKQSLECENTCDSKCITTPRLTGM